MTDETIHKLSQSIRDILFNAVTGHLFLKSVDNRFQIVACLDTIEDVQLAIDEYRRLHPSEDQTNTGRLYLAVYGVLQGMFLQQDALMNLANAIGFPFRLDDYPSLKDIREIRNQIVGHPTSYKRRKTESYYAINRNSLSLKRFDVMEYNKKGGQAQVASVDLTQKLSDNESLILQALRDLRGKLEDDIDKHKAEFRDRHLATLFHESLDYMCEKLLTGALDSNSESDRYPAAAAVEVIDSMLSDLNNALSERGKPPEAWASVDLVRDELRYPMAALRAFYLDEDNGIQAPDPEAVRIFARFVKSNLHELRDICSEIDEYYDSD